MEECGMAVGSEYEKCQIRRRTIERFVAGDPLSGYSRGPEIVDVAGMCDGAHDEVGIEVAGVVHHGRRTTLDVVDCFLDGSVEGLFVGWR